MDARVADIARTTILPAFHAEWCWLELAKRDVAPDVADRAIRAYANLLAANPQISFREILEFLPQPTR